MSAQPPNPELAALPDLFLLDKRHRAFVEGRSRHIPANPTWLYVVTLVFLLVFLPCGFRGVNVLIIEGNWQVALTSLCLPGLVVLEVIFILFRVLKARHMIRYGRVLRADVIVLSGEETRDDLGHPWVTLNLHYKFNTPDGRIIEKHKVLPSMRPQHFEKFSLRSSGASLAVLYVNDNLYKLL